MTRNGKIARLPHHLRKQLNRRLQDGEPGKTLVEWLNGQPGVVETLKEQFYGRPINEQNLSEWKQGGYQDWLKHEESRAFIENLTEQSGELEEMADGVEISDRFGSILATEMTRLATQLLESETDPEKRWQRLREIHRELSQLRRDDHRAVRTFIKRDRWTRESEREDREIEKRYTEELRKRSVAPYWALLQRSSLAEMFGGGEVGRNLASQILEAQNDLPPGTLSGKPAQAKSTPVKPDQTESNPGTPPPPLPDGLP